MSSGPARHRLHRRGRQDQPQVGQPSITATYRRGVQQALLKIMEAPSPRCRPGGRKHPQQEFLQVDTTTSCSSRRAFRAGKDHLRRGKGTSIGFGATVADPESVDRRDLRAWSRTTCSASPDPNSSRRLVLATLEDWTSRPFHHPDRAENAFVKQYQRCSTWRTSA